MNVLRLMVIGTLLSAITRRSRATARCTISALQARVAGRFDRTLRDFVDRLAKRFGSKVEIVKGVVALSLIRCDQARLSLNQASRLAMITL